MWRHSKLHARASGAALGVLALLAAGYRLLVKG
jgi:hypothetical protein